jgi:hypothetical protein
MPRFQRAQIRTFRKKSRLVSMRSTFALDPIWSCFGSWKTGSLPVETRGRLQDHVALKATPWSHQPSMKYWRAPLDLNLASSKDSLYNRRIIASDPDYLFPRKVRLEGFKSSPYTCIGRCMPTVEKRFYNTTFSADLICVLHLSIMLVLERWRDIDFWIGQSGRWHSSNY